MMIIGFSGFAGAGKSTAAKVLVENGFSLLSFATPVKKVAHCFLEQLGYGKYYIQQFENDKSYYIKEIEMTYRQLLQKTGTEYGREQLHPDIWLQIASVEVGKKSLVVFDDVRFENEAQFIRQRLGVIVHIKNQNKTSTNHKSEKGIMVRDNDIVIYNNCSLNDFQDKVFESLANYIK